MTRIYVAWSGQRSKLVAESLSQFLVQVLPTSEPWLATSDIHIGNRWSEEIGIRLLTTTVGILVVTRDNVHRPWLNFEAGALAMTLRAGVIPFLFDLPPTELSGPLTQYQTKTADKSGVRELANLLNAVAGRSASRTAEVTTLFDSFWPSLAERFRVLQREEKHASTSPPTPPPTGSGQQIGFLHQVLRELRRIAEAQEAALVPSDPAERSIDHLEKVLADEAQLEIEELHSKRERIRSLLTKLSPRALDLVVVVAAGRTDVVPPPSVEQELRLAGVLRDGALTELGAGLASVIFAERQPKNLLRQPPPLDDDHEGNG